MWLKPFDDEALIESAAGGCGRVLKEDSYGSHP